MSVTPYALQCCVERDNVRTLRSMLQCLDRFGKELFLEANETEARAISLSSHAPLRSQLNLDLRAQTCGHTRAGYAADTE
jgi:hypothetical protein